MEGSLNQKRIWEWTAKETIIHLLFISAFFHFAITAVMILVALIFILKEKSSLKTIFSHPGSRFIPAFSAFTTVVAIFRGNWAGAACSVGFLLILMISLWVRSNMKRSTFEKSLSFCSIISCVLTPFAFIQATFFPTVDERVTLWFFNSNYMAFMCLIAFTIAIYKLLVGKGHLWIYAVSAVCNLISMYYCSSIFIWIDVFVVAILLIVLFKKWPLLAIIFAIGVVACIALICNPQLLPRWYAVDNATDFRFSIWKAAMDAIKKSPFCGYGFLAFNLLNGNYPEAYAAPHTHNILMESFLDFGIIGTALLLPYFVLYFKKLKKCYEYSVNRNTTNLILTLMITTVVHGFVDIVFLWIQTGLILALITGGLGMDEKLLDRVITKEETMPKPSQSTEQEAL